MTFPRSAPLRITHVITDLDVGGAEMVLLRMLERTHGTSVDARVISLSGEGVLVAALRDLGVTVLALPPGSRSKAFAVPTITREMRRTRPQLVQTWMYHADVLGGLAARRARIPVVWGLHAAPMIGDEPIRLRTRAGLTAAALLSRRVPTRIVCCSHQTRRVHVRLGYDESKMITIPNGFEVDDEDVSARASVRDELGISHDTPLVGRVGRDHPQKDSATLLAAFALLNRDVPAARLVLVGEGFTRTNVRLLEQARTAGVPDSNIFFLGPRNDISRLNRSFDVAVSSSYSEGLPVVLGEAMSVGTPVVATDAGDSALLIDDARRVVAPRDPLALSEAIKRVLELDGPGRSRLGRRDRERIEKEFGLDRMVASYVDLYESIAGV